MLDTATREGKIIQAALQCAEARPWRAVTLAEIASAADMTLVELADVFSGKGDIVAALIRHVDREVLKGARVRQGGDSARDALFEVVMSRFDALMPYRAALRSIAGSGLPDPALIKPFIDSQMWMLEAAGIASDGVGGAARALGLGSVYASVFRVWLDDDDPGMARTMAALDRRLRRGERSIQAVDGIWDGVGRFVDAIRGGLRARAPEAPGATYQPPGADGGYEAREPRNS